MEYFFVQTGGQPAPNPDVPWQHTQVTITPITPMIHPPPIAQHGQAMYQMQVTIAPTIQAPYSAQHGQAMYQSATNLIYQNLTQPTVMELIYQNAIPHG